MAKPAPKKIKLPQVALVGRLHLYKTQLDQRVHELALLGLPVPQVAAALGISEPAFQTWRKKHPSFDKAFSKGKEEADGKVARGLFQRATGYDKKSEKVFCANGVVVRAETTVHYPADPGAAAMWLKNRQPKLWRDGEPTQLVHNNIIQIPPNLPPEKLAELARAVELVLSLSPNEPRALTDSGSVAEPGSPAIDVVAERSSP